MIDNADHVWAQALACLVARHPAAMDSLAATVRRLRAAGGVPFEVIAGTPASRYGARITFRGARGSDPVALAAAAGLAAHPWGPPDFIGVRTDADGTTRCKGYHRRPPAMGSTTVHRGLPTGLDPVMAAADSSGIEVYAIQPGELRWETFAQRCLASLGVAPPDAGFSPRPWPCPRRFAVSARHVAGDLTAVTLYAFPPALPDDEHVATAWTAAMSQDERVDYVAAVAAVASLGRATGRLHALLGWSFGPGGFTSRSASLRVPPLADDVSPR
jgi:hypothetical protein